MDQPDSPQPLDSPIQPTTPNYHISVWDEPPTYVCLRCTAVGMTLPEVSLHVQVEHGELPTPTPMIPQLLAMRAESMPVVEPHHAPTTPDEEDPAHA